MPGQPGLPGQPGEKGDPGDDAPQIDDTQESAEHPWSGKKVSEELSSLSSQKVDKNQGTAHAGKYLKIGSDGIVAPGEGGGASYTAGYGISISESNVISVSFTNAEQEAF